MGSEAIFAGSVRGGGWRSAFGRLRPRMVGGGWNRPRVWLLLALLGLVCLGAYEARTSALEAWLFSRWAREMGYSIEQGPSHEVLVTRAGPFDERAGFTRVREFQALLETNGFETVEQARFSRALTRLVGWGISPPFREPADAGLSILDAHGATMFDFARHRPRFERFEEIPLAILRTLLFIEDRQLAEEVTPRRNPVVDWGRLAVASGRYAGRKIGLPISIEGGSTLATQMEKYRHSQGGRTGSPADKLKQMASASLRAYLDGPDTSEERRRIVLDYINSVPLAAAPGYGEVHGLGEGLRVWFGLELGKVRRELERPGTTKAKARIYKQALALIYSVRAPSRYLLHDRQDLSEKVDDYLGLLRDRGVVDPALAELALATPLVFPRVAPPAPPPPLADGKASSEIRRRLTGLLDVRDLYALDRLHVEAATTIDGGLQQRTASLFRDLADPAFVAAQGLHQPRLLEEGAPSRVVYSLLLMEATDRGNLIRVHADSHPAAFDVNSGMKMELGSTAKLRTLVHYLDVVDGLRRDLAGSARDPKRDVARDARDPITQWAATTLREDPNLDGEAFLQRALDRRYSASPRERFFTGGGAHNFRNFDSAEDRLMLSVREAAARSTNLVFVRLMRDLVRYHEARLPYDARAILESPESPERRALLESVAEEETRAALQRAWLRFRGLPAESLAASLLGRRADSPRHLAIVYFAWHPAGDEAGLLGWLRASGLSATSADARRLTRSYGGRRHSLSDYGWLADVHPLDLWCAGELAATPNRTWEETLASSEEARRDASAWLFKTRNRRAQDTRLRTRIERDAFERMTASWRRLGFPFERMVPSYASAIGSSADRPTGLADLMSILMNDGVRRSARLFDEIRLAPGTPYYTALRPSPPESERVLPAEVARAVRGVLVGTVQTGTATRLRGAFTAPDGSPLVVGGKTGSGDNRLSTFTRGGDRVASEVLNRTAAFVFFVGDRHFGVITASVDGPDAAEYRFTSSLPLAVLRLLAPEISRRASAPVMKKLGPIATS